MPITVYVLMFLTFHPTVWTAVGAYDLATECEVAKEKAIEKWESEQADANQDYVKYHTHKCVAYKLPGGRPSFRMSGAPYTSVGAPPH
jgi:hypothetical protein